LSKKQIELIKKLLLANKDFILSAWKTNLRIKKKLYAKRHHLELYFCGIVQNGAFFLFFI
jgi:hypothetical protein